MCVAAAGQVGRITGEGIERRAVVKVGQAQREVSLALLPDVAAGDWVIFQSGFALRGVAPEEVEELNALIEGIRP